MTESLSGPGTSSKGRVAWESEAEKTRKRKSQGIGTKIKNPARRGRRIGLSAQVYFCETCPKRDVPGFRQDEFFELDFDPGKAEAAAGGPGKIRGEPFEQFAGDAAGFGLKNFAEGVLS